MNFRTALWAAALALSLPAASAEIRKPQPEKPVIAVSILPQRYFVQRIAVDRVRTLVLVGPGQSPHSYEPTPRQMADLGSAAAWLRIGVEFETALAPKVANLYPGLRIVDTTRGVQYRTLKPQDHEEHGPAESEADDTHEGGRDPHIWLGREGARSQATYVRDLLARIDPAGTPVYARNCEALLRDIDAVFESLAESLAPLKGKPVFVYHPSFGYFLDEFGIEQVAVEVGGKEPTQKSLAELIRLAQKDGVRVVFVQPQFSRNAAKSVAKAIGGTVAEINALDADWLENLERMGEALKSAIR